MHGDTKSPICHSCGGAVPADARFCPSCGVSVIRRMDSPAAIEGEHRQITVMFCDLVGSTALSTVLDSEDLRDVLRSYHAICASAVERRDGLIAQYLGDGVLAYFGYPRAQEDAAIRAADAALEIVREVDKAGSTLMQRKGLDFATRIALHTGRVLIGEMGAGHTRESHALTGVVPNLAARLEQLAPRNGIVISAQTRSRISGGFRIESMGQHDLKGFAEPIDVYRVTGRQKSIPVLPVLDAPVVGREAELSTLAEIWASVSAGESRQVTVVAEPGSGKSALAAAFVSALDLPPNRLIEMNGTLSDRNTPFSCLRRTIDRWTAVSQAKDARPSDQQIASWFGADSLRDSAHAMIFHRLWNGELIPGPENRAAVFAACDARMDGLPKPFLIVLDDAHWADPSTQEMLNRLLDRSDGIMILRLSRPDAALPENGETVSLSGLGLDSCRRLAATVAGAPVDKGLASLIADVSNGMPLFVEEFTKSLRDSGQIRIERGVYRAASLYTDVATPASILDLITVRLDALGGAKALAQVCAVLGRSFTREALTAVSGETEERMEAGISALLDSGVLVREWSGMLSFRHALFQAGAYESLIRSARQRWHKRFLDWLESRPNLLAETPPETLAYHLEACGRHKEAADRYLDAGLAANPVSASLEAAAHFRKCCDLLAGLPDGAGLGPLRLQARVMLANALLSARGPGAPETRAAYSYAVDLAGQLPESEWHFAAYWGWWRVSENFTTMAQRANRLLSISDSMTGLEFKLQAKHCVWANAFQMGEFGTSIETARGGLLLYEEGRFDEHETHYGGHDCKVCALGEIALASWLQGAGDAALDDARAAVAHAEHLDHLGSLLHALDIIVMLHHYRGDCAATADVAARLGALAVQHDLEDYRAKSEIFLGWVEIESGQVENGLARVEAGFGTMRQIGTPEDFPVYQSIRAAAMNRLGDADGAMIALADARAIIAAEGVNYWGAEIARLEARIEMTRTDIDRAFIADRFAEARKLARQQDALALELRACLSQHEWMQREGRDTGCLISEISALRARFPSDAAGRDLDAADAILAPDTVE